ncbi:uncharacterized protein LOC114645747 isoform X3 [Erpetoichthys calabaricus]|uniref:uncharacterized protein LOC114645747 isoform X3 n=1 Tax=Erpetoichthys calabaricus TaxID=27687 RepID=UPI0022345175|nr:uncharacterized protein LOC114645747 isoform X3 [Erpetoichthys calabaricus]
MGSVDRISVYQKRFLEDLDPGDIQDKVHIFAVESKAMPSDLTEFAHLFHEFISEESFIIPPEIWRSWDWLFFKEMLLMKCVKKKVQIFDLQLGDSGEFKVVVVGFKDEINPVCQKILNFLKAQNTASESVSFGKREKEFLSFFLQTSDLSKPKVLDEGLSMKYKVCDSRVEITGTKANVQRATTEIQRVISKCSTHSQSKNSGLNISIEPFKHFKVVICSGRENIHLGSESLIVQSSSHEILFDGTNQETVVGELSEITLTVNEGLSELGKLQKVIRLHWQCKFNKKKHTEVLEAAVIKALEYVKTQGQTSVSICCPLDKDLNTSIQAATVAAALEGFCKAQSYLFVSSLAVFIVCPNDTEWANIMKKKLEIVWAYSNSEQNGMQEIIPVIPQNITVRLVGGTLEENQVQALAVPVTVSSKTKSIELSCLCAHKPSYNLEEFLQIRSPCLADRLQNGEIIPVTCWDSGLLYEYLYLIEVQDDWEDPAEKVKSFMNKCATLSHHLFLTSMAVPVLDLSGHGVPPSQVVKWLLEGLKMFERETSFSWLHSVRLVLSPDCTDFSLVMEGIKRSEEPLGICFADHPFFIQYLQDSNQAFMEISLNMEKTSSSFSIFKKSKKHCLSISKQEYISAEMSLAKWKTAQAKIYNRLRRRYNLKNHHIPNLPQVEKYEPNLKKLQSIKLYEHETWVVGLTEEVNEYIRLADLNRHVEETISNEIWGNLTAKAIQHVTEDLQLELDACLPTVIASHDTTVPPNITFLGPYKTMYSAIDVFKKLISKALLCVSLSNKLSDYKYAFLNSWNLSALSQKLFHSRYIKVTLTELDNSLMMQGDSFEDNQQAMEVLKDDIYEAAIRISRASHTSTKGEKWRRQLEDILHRLNTSEQKVEIHTIQDKDNNNCMVVVVGFKTEVHAAKRILNQYFQQNTDIKRILEFKQPNIVEAGNKLLDIIDKKDLFGAEVEVNVHTNSKVDVILSGTRSEVQKAQEILKRDLDSVIKKSVKIEGLGAARYFQDPETAEILKRIGLTYFCIISTRRQCMAWPNDPKNYPLSKIYEGLTEPVEFDLIGRPADIEKAIGALQSHFRDCQTQNMICDPQIEKLTPSQLHAVTKDLSVILHLTNNGLSLEGLKSHVDEAQTRLGEMLKTDKGIKNPEEQNIIKQTISCNVKGQINNTASNNGLDWLSLMRNAAKASADSGKNPSPSIKNLEQQKKENSHFQDNTDLTVRKKTTTSATPSQQPEFKKNENKPKDEVLKALLTDSKENLHQNGVMSSSGVTCAVPSNVLFDLPAANSFQQLYLQPSCVPGHVPILNANFDQLDNFWQTTSCIQDSAVPMNTRVGLPLGERYFSIDAEDKQNKTAVHNQASEHMNRNLTTSGTVRTSLQNLEQQNKENSHLQQDNGALTVYQKATSATPSQHSEFKKKDNKPKDGALKALLTDSKENLCQNGEMSSSGVTYTVPSNNLFDLQATNLHQQLYPQPNHVPGHIPILNSSFGQMNNFWNTTSSFQDSAVLTNTRVGLPLDELYFSTDAEEKQNKTTGHNQTSEHMNRNRTTSDILEPGWNLQEDNFFPKQFTTSTPNSITTHRVNIKDLLVDYTSPRPSPLHSSFPCNFPGCSRSFDTSNALQSHYRQMHTSEGRATCSKCGKESTKSGITQHEKACMGNSFSYISEVTPSPSIQSMQYDTGLGAMSDGLSFITPISSTPVTPVVNLGFDLKPKSLFNNSTFHSDPVTEYTLPSPSSLYSSFLCHYPDCCRSFDTSHGLQSHYRQMHTPEGRAKCSKCGKESTKSGITQHEKTCMGNSISYIPKATPSPILQSIKYDTGLGAMSDGLPFITPNISTPVTPVGNLGFDLKPKSLFKNSTFHSDPVTEYTLPSPSSLYSSFLCHYPDCCRSFDTSNGLQSHYRQMHTPEGRAKCSKCGKESTKSGITQHEKTCMGSSFSYIPKATPSPILQSMQHDSSLGTMSDGLSFITPISSTPVGNLGFDLKPKSLFNHSIFHSGIKQNSTISYAPSYTKAFTCFCGRSFDSQRGLSCHHTQIHTASGRARCYTCGLESTKSGITRHKCKKR